MGSDGAVAMWAVLTEDQKLIEEGDCLWPELPRDLRISEFKYKDRRGDVGTLNGFDAYGFQRVGIVVPGGPSGVMGVQLIAIKGDDVKVVEINEVTGKREVRELSRSELTYDPGLLRDGV